MRQTDFIFLKMEILKSNKGNTKIAYEGFLYTPKKNLPEPYTVEVFKSMIIKMF